MRFIFYFIHNTNNKSLDIEFICNCHYVYGWFDCILDPALHQKYLPASQMTLVSKALSCRLYTDIGSVSLFNGFKFVDSNDYVSFPKCIY